MFCPRQRRSIEISRCSACERMRSIAWDPDAGGYLECDVTAPAPRNLKRGDLAEVAVRSVLHDVMRPISVCVRPETTVARLRGEFESHKVDALLVLTEERDLVGVVAPADLLGASDDMRAEDVLSADIEPLLETAPVAHAIAVMGLQCVRAVAVVTEDGEVVGSFDAGGALRWMAVQMGYSEVE